MRNRRLAVVKGWTFERGLQPPYISLATDVSRHDWQSWTVRIDEVKSQLAQLEQQTEAVPEGDAEASGEAANNADIPRRQQAEQELERLRAARKKLRGHDSHGDGHEGDVPDPRPAHIS